MREAFRKVGRRLREAFVRPVFGDDIFLSYSRRDSAYILELANRLVERRFSPYVDQWASPVGAELPLSLRRALSRSSMLVVVATPASARSENVEREIREFLVTQRALCIVDVDGAISDARWLELVRGPEPIRERSDALTSGEPSADVITRIASAARFTRAKVRIRRLAFTALALLTLAVLGVLFFGDRAASARLEEQRARGAAAESAERATREDQRARAAAERATAAAEETAKAKQELQVVRAAAAEADAARQQALSEAERQTRLADSRRLANESRLMLPIDPLQASRVGLKALELEPTDEAVRAVRDALGAPRPSRILPGRYIDLDFGQGRYFTLGKDGVVTVWDQDTGKQIRTLPEANIQTAEWSPGGTLLVTTSTSGSVTVWDQAGKAVTKFGHTPGSVRHAAFGIDDDHILVAQADGTLSGRNIGSQTADRILQLQDAAVHRVWYSENLLYVWSEHEHTYQRGVWHVGGDGKLTKLGPFPESYFREPRRPRGRWLVLVDKFEKPPDPQHFTIKLSGSHLAIERDATLAITATENMATLWHAWTNRPLVELPPHDSNITHAAFSRDRAFVATLTDRGVARIWPFESRLLARGPDRPMVKQVVSLAFSPDGKKLVSGDVWGDVLLWDVASGEAADLDGGVKNLRSEKSRVLFDSSGDRLLIAAQGGRALVWDWRGGRALAEHRFGEGELARFAKSGTLAATARSAGGIAFWWPGTDKTAEIDTKRSYCEVVLTADGSHAITTTHDGLIAVRRVDTWGIVASLERRTKECASLAIDEAHADRVVVWTPAEAFVWSWKQASRGPTLDTGSGPIAAVAVDKTSGLVAIATKSDLRVFDMLDGSLVRRIGNLGRENLAVALWNGVIATGESAMGAGAYVYLQRCVGCVAQNALASKSREAIGAQLEQLVAAGLTAR